MIYKEEGGRQKMAKTICTHCELYGHTCIGREGKVECETFEPRKEVDNDTGRGYGDIKKRAS